MFADSEPNNDRLNRASSDHHEASEYTVINGYRFVSIAKKDLPDLRASLFALASSHKMHGTILLSEEGVNVALCGKVPAVQQLLDDFKAFAIFDGLVFKKMPNDKPIFRRLIVKIKAQIIVFEDHKIDPNCEDNQRMMPKELKKILDEDPDSIVLLDTRNQFEVAFGAFKQAETLPVRRFRGFCDVLDQAEIDKDKPIVTYCTGGVRCEKVVPYMRKKGYRNVYQLEGGIFNYFKEVGGEHWEGECFVFDYRTALDANLKATGTVQCRHCYGPVSLEQQQDVRYVFKKSCPNCYVDEEKRA